MIAELDILNERYSPDEQILTAHYSGHLDDLPDKVLNHLNGHHCSKLNAGDWITIVDGEVVEVSEFCPYYIDVEEQSPSEALREASEADHLTSGEKVTLKQAADIMDRC